MDSIFVKFLKYLRSNSTENTSDADFLALVNETLNVGTFSVPKSETSTRMRTCEGNPEKILYIKPYYFGRLHNFNVFFNKLNSIQQTHESSECCLDFYGTENEKSSLKTMFSRANKTLWFCCSNFFEHSIRYILILFDDWYDKSSAQHNVYVNENSYPYIDFLTEGIIEYPNGIYDTMIKEFLDNINLLHTDSHKFIAFMYMYRTGVVMGEVNSNLILMTTKYYNTNY